MAKVKIQGHASGTGILTVTAPNTSSDRTITLPDATGTLLNSDGSGANLTSLPAAQVSGTHTSFTSTGIDDNANATAITIDSNENVGIGVTPESWKSSTWATLQFGNAGSLSGRIDSNGIDLGSNFYYDSVDSRWEYINTDEASLYNQAGGIHTFKTAASGSADAEITWTTVMTLHNSGDIELGNYSGSGSTSGVSFGLATDDEPSICSSATSTGNQDHYKFYNPNGLVGRIITNGSNTSYETSSDYRLKENVVPMTGSIDRLKELNPSRFNFIADADKTVDGFLAHEAQTVVPEAISGEKDAMRTEEYEVEPAVLDDVGKVVTEAVMGEREVIDAQGIDQSKLVPLLTGALQEAVAKIEELTTRIETLEAE